MSCCDRCGAEGAKEISGRAARMTWLKSTYNSSSEERRPSIAERIMDLFREREMWRCEACMTCGCCYLVDDHLVECAICRAPACANCSLPALRVDQDGRIIEGSDEGAVLCSRCNPPSGGRNAGRGLPCPAQPLVLR